MFSCTSPSTKNNLPTTKLLTENGNQNYMSGSIEGLLEKYPEQVSMLVLKLREFLFKQLTEIQEQPDISARVIGYGYGPGYKQSICTIILSQNGVKLGFYKGTELKDPHKLLTGSGKVHKYVMIKSQQDMNQPLAKLLKEALIAYKKRS